ncbi:MAG: exosome complex RNA-binding protein Rrp4 [Cenarchaeum symbiont of Oopsacas minuta]|nr:exosome complex RNA-binding protein Rrp4 [Cenarchaeum symbiont of Oopsacas minuta]
MSDERRKHVLPGEVITSRPLRPEENVIFDGKNISSTIVGMSEIYDETVRVLPLTGMYFPKVDDMVVGKIVSHTSLSWEVDINSCYVGFLPASDIFGRDFTASADALASKLIKGDMVAARIANFDRTRDPLITVSDRDLGKIDTGEIVRISSSKIPRLIGKRGSMIQMIEESTNSMITAGQNGWIIVDAKDADGLLKAKRAIKMIDDNAHMQNLTDKIQSMLNS